MQGVNQGGKSTDNKLMTQIAATMALEQAVEAKTQAHFEAQEDFDEDEDVVEAWRQRRLNEMRNKREKLAENVAVRGHGEYREITQDEFLPAVTGSDKVVCHFYHDDFLRCKVLDQHLRVIAQHHPETKFVCINAEKAPFFIDKLQIRVLPTMVVFHDGKAIDRIIGFEGISDRDQFPTAALARQLVKKRAIEGKQDSGSDSDD